VAADVSICVATCRRPEGLSRLLTSLARMRLPKGIRVELIVVDNDPAGSAAAFLAGFAAPFAMRCFAEPRRNIAHARNRAVEEARGRWIAFVDDDEVVDPGWIEAYWSAVDAVACDGFFGPVQRRVEEVVTPWLDVDRFFSGPRLADRASVGPGEFATNNALVRADLFDDRRFDPHFGLRGGSDTELFARMWSAGAQFCWCDTARVQELIPPGRHRLGWLMRRAFRGGFVTTLLEQRRLGTWTAARRGVPRALAALSLVILGLPLAALAGRAAAARVWLRGCTQAGHLWALLGFDFQEYA
jgi:succinoglycan biosynthesis protein ExoM